MKQVKKSLFFLVPTVLLALTYFGSCRHDDSVEPYKPAEIVRGDAKVKLTDGFAFDKSHSNVTWETNYYGVGSMLTGRFNTFGLTKFSFEENKKDSIYFEAYVWLNKVNTGEPGRDTGCLLTTYGVTKTMGDTLPNVAKIRSKSVEYSTKDKGYFVKCDFTFHGVTKEVEAKLDYTEFKHFNAGEVSTKALDIMGFTLKFQFLAKTDFQIVSSSITDKVDITANVQLKKTYN